MKLKLIFVFLKKIRTKIQNTVPFFMTSIFKTVNHIDSHAVRKLQHNRKY